MALFCDNGFAIPEVPFVKSLSEVNPSMERCTDEPDNKPYYVVALERAFGEPSQSAFGSATFFVPAAKQSQSLEVDAAAIYRHFIGEAWERLGETNWLNEWSCVYVRQQNSSLGIVVEMKSINDREARQSIGLLLENTEDSIASSDAIQTAFDHALVSELRIYKIGDGSALSGILIAARLLDTGSLFLALLMD